MKIRVSVDRQSGPIIGSRLDFDHQVDEPEVDELRLPRLAPDASPQDCAEYQKACDRRNRFIDQLSATIARSIAKGLEVSLDGRARSY